MAPSAIENDVPMQGAGFYNAHSDLQAAAMHRALPLFDSIASQTVTVPFSVVEYGCAQGANSILPFKRILQARFLPHKPATDNGDNREAEEALLTFSDREGNDFSTLEKTIAQTQWFPADRNFLQPRVFTSMVAGNFYDRLVPRDSVDVGFSLATLHHLDRLHSTDDLDATSKQAHEDLVKFLSLRAQEIRKDGTIVLSFVSRASTGAANYPELVDACRLSLIQMVAEQRISPQVACAFHVPTHDRTLQEVQRSLDEVKRLWQAEQVIEEEITHPAYDQLQSAAGTEGNEKASGLYAETVVDWMMAVIMGYFVKALRTAAPELDADARGELAAEWRNRTKEVFFEQYRDCKVSCWFIFVKLLRV